MEKLPEWKLYSLEMDMAGKTIGKFFQRKGYGISRLKAGALKYLLPRYTDFRNNIERAIIGAIPESRRALVAYGDGSFHHFTYGLCRLADRLSSEYCYIHIDHHHDAYWHDETGRIGCGSFVGWIAKETNAKGFPKANIIFVGNNESGIGKAINENELRSEGGMRTLERMLDDTPREAYVTMDLDVMHRSELITSYDRGTLRKRELLDILALIKSKKHIISADVLGFNYPSAAGLLMKKRSLELYRSIVDALIGREAKRW